MGGTEEILGGYQTEFVTDIRESFLRPLEEYMADMKHWKHLRGKLENRRLDYDAKLNKLQKSKKEKPELDEEMRAAQQKYDQTLEEVTQLMISLNDREEPQLESLNKLLNHQLDYHTKCAQKLTELKATLLDPSVRVTTRAVSNPTLRRIMTSTMASTSNVSSLSSRPQSSTLLNDGTPDPIKSSSAFSFSQTPTTGTLGRQLTETAPSPNSTLSRSGTAEPRKLMRANYSFQAENPGELTILKGQLIQVVQEIDEGWWLGESEGKRGIFPANYCAKVDPATVATTTSTPIGTSTVSLKASSSQNLTAAATAVAAPPQQEVNSGHQSPVPPARRLGRTPTSNSNAGSALNIDGAIPSVLCSQCGCEQFSESPFKKAQCVNCFHTH